MTHWETVSNALHSTSSLLCTATQWCRRGCKRTPKVLIRRKSLESYQMFGHYLEIWAKMALNVVWLKNRRPNVWTITRQSCPKISDKLEEIRAKSFAPQLCLLLRKLNRTTKQDDLVEEVDLEENPSHAYIRHKDGRVLKYLAPFPRSSADVSSRPSSPRDVQWSIPPTDTVPHSLSPEDDTQCANSPTGVAPPDSAENPVVTTPVLLSRASPVLHPSYMPELTVQAVCYVEYMS